SPTRRSSDLLHFFTSPLRWSKVCLLAAFETTVITLCCFPSCPALLNTTFTKPWSPGAIGFFEYSGVVQPHDACTLEMISGELPVLVNLNSCSIFSPSLTVPKSYESSATSSTASLESTSGTIICPTGCLPTSSIGISAASSSWFLPMLHDANNITPAKIKDIHF